MNKISPLRRAVPTPDTLVDESGKPAFGTFSQTFKQFDLLRFKSSSKFRKLINKLRLTEWEAVEVISAKGAFLTAVYKFGILDINLTVFFEKENGKLHVWNNMDLFLNRCHLAKTLFDGRSSVYQTKKAKTVITNNYETGMAVCQGFAKNKKSGRIEFDFGLKRMSKPSVVSIPIKGVYPVYTEKDIFKFNGSIKIDGIEMTDNDSMAVIDDHRGYYPRKSGYDWLTTFKYRDLDDKKVPFGLNLTDFRLNPKQFDYNENGYWDKTNFHLLPITHFERNGKIKTIKDSFGDINLTLETTAMHKVSLNLLLFRIDYQLSFGKLNGYITDQDNNKIEFKDDLALSEYRYTII